MKIEILCHFDLLRAKNLPNMAVQFAEGLASCGNKVEVVVPYIFRKDSIRISDIFNSYGIKKSFKIKILKTIIFANSYKRYILIMLIFFHFFRSLKLFFISIFKKEEKRIIIATLSYILIPYVILLKKIARSKNIKILPWEHEFHKRKGEVWVYKNCDGMLVTNSIIKRDLMEEFDISKNKIFVTYNPVSNSRLHTMLPKEEIRKRLNIEINEGIIVYTGKIGINIKEVQYIIETATLLPDCFFIMTGGKPEVIKYFNDLVTTKGIKNIFFTGFLFNYNEIKYYQLAADILIAYYSKYDIDVRYNLPAKIGEYMTTKNPIVTVNHPATRDILNKDNVYFVEPDNPAALAEGIGTVLKDKRLASYLAQNAYNSVKRITYEKVTEAITDFFEKI